MKYNIGDRIKFKNSNEIYKVLEYKEEEGYKTHLERVGATVIIPNWQTEYTELVNEQVSEQVSKYKVGDIVKLSTGERATITRMFRDNVNEVFRYSATIGDDDYDEYNLDEKEIVGPWEECKPSEQVEKYNEHTLDALRYAVDNKLEPKYKLIDILNKIANGELKEGTVVVWDDVEYPYKNKCLYGADGEKLFYWINTGNLNDKVELIEPQEPTDNTTEKIEELKQLDMDFAEIDFASHEEYARCSIQVLAREMIKQIDKLNEVIRYINKGAEK